jgi:hypothetical protein
MQHRQNGDPLGMPAVASCRSQRRVFIQCDQQPSVSYSNRTRFTSELLTSELGPANRH